MAKRSGPKYPGSVTAPVTACRMKHREPAVWYAAALAEPRIVRLIEPIQPVCVVRRCSAA